MLKFAQGALNTILFHRPMNVRLWLTYRCNYDCKMCGIRARRLRGQLELAQLEVVARNLKQLHVNQVILTGGEALLRPDIVQVIKLFAARDFLVRLQTNGAAHATEELLGRCYDAGLQDISVSYDTMDPAHQDAICGASGVTQNALRVLDFCAQNFGHRGVVAANVVFSRQNFEELPTLAEFIHRRGLFFDPCILSRTFSGTPADGGHEEEFLLAGYDPLAARRVLDRLSWMVRRNYRIVTTRRTLADFRRYVLSGDMSWRCRAGQLSFDVLPTGELAPCCDTLEAAFEQPVADLSREDFMEVYRSAAFAAKCARVRDACAGCLYGCYKDPVYLSRDPRVQLEALYKALVFGKLLH